MAVSVFSGDDFLKVDPHFLELAGKSPQTIQLRANHLTQVALAGVLDVAHKVLDADFFLHRGLDARRHVNELAVHITVSIDLFLGEIRFRRQIDIVLLVDPNNDKSRLSVVAAQHLVDVNVVLADLRAG